MDTLRQVIAGAGISLAIGAGLVIRGDMLFGAVLLAIGMANLYRTIQLWKEKGLGD